MPMTKTSVGAMLNAGTTLVADRNHERKLVKQTEDGTFLMVTIDCTHKRSQTLVICRTCHNRNLRIVVRLEDC